LDSVTPNSRDQKLLSFYETFLVFLKLGCTSFGGPVAHIGFFRDAFVANKKWLDDRRFGDYLALCQFIPGPASSQLGMAIGYHRARYLGALAAWLGFTLPSAIVLGIFAAWLSFHSEWLESGLTKGLKLIALAVVIHAFMDMRGALAPDLSRVLIMIFSSLVFLAWMSPFAPIVVLLVVGLAGVYFKPVESDVGKDRIQDIKSESDGSFALHIEKETTGSSPRIASYLFLASFFCLLLLPAVVQHSSDVFAQFSAYYRSGALVFGGGHVVLPLLEQEVVSAGWVELESFLAGYGAAQAVPGPLFTFASFLGASHSVGATGAFGWGLATVAVFLPSFLLLFGVLPFWESLRARPKVRSALWAINASILGLLLATIVDPLISTSISGAIDIVFCALAIVLIRYLKAPLVPVVIAGALLGVFLY
jgi:chromate transporter